MPQTSAGASWAVAFQTLKPHTELESDELSWYRSSCADARYQAPSAERKGHIRWRTSLFDRFFLTSLPFSYLAIDLCVYILSFRALQVILPL